MRQTLHGPMEAVRISSACCRLIHASLRTRVYKYLLNMWYVINVHRVIYALLRTLKTAAYLVSQYQISTSRKLQEPVQFWTLSWIKSETNRTALRYASTISLNAGAIATPSRPPHMGTRATSPLVIVASQRTLSVSIMLCWNARTAKPEGPTLWRLKPASVDLPDASPCRTRVEC